MPTCLLPDCDSTKVKGLGFCENHLKRYRRGTLTLPPGVTPQPKMTHTDRERFDLFVNLNGPLSGHRPDLGPCWLWTGGTDRHGYGRTGNQAAHRWAYVYLGGVIPEGHDLDHLCRVPLCVRPTHLDPVTRRENLRRGAGSGGVLAPPRTHCKNNHDLRRPGATYTSTHKGKVRTRCRECRRAIESARRSRRRDQGPPGNPDTGAGAGRSGHRAPV